MEYDFGVNQALVEELFLRYSENPAAVSAEWRTYFSRLGDAATAARPAQHGDESGAVAAFWGPLTSAGASGTPATRDDDVENQARVSRMVNSYRVRGHLFANLDPLGLRELPPFDLSLASAELGGVAIDTPFLYDDKLLPLGEIFQRLNNTYCRSIGAEFTFIEDPDERIWLQHRMEESQNRVDLDRDTQLRILTKLTDTETFERFLHTTYLGAKRFSIEGAESLIPMLELVIDRGAALGVDEIVMGMAHRGRLNVLINVLELPPHDILAAFEDKDAERYYGRGDVKYHLGHSSDRRVQGRDLHLTLAFNPSHLEFVNPVVEGRCRAKQDRREDRAERRTVLPLLIHGDASFIGQGVVAETLNLSGLEAYDTGGTIHVVVNNQIGFTTTWTDSRASRYCTDVTRMLRCPVFHVNGEDPEAVAHVAQMATEFRQKFGRDVVIDIYCYRKYGHNEGDEPRFTQPVMYAAIDKKKTIREQYVETLVAGGKVARQECEEIQNHSRQRYERALEEVRATVREYDPDTLQGRWSGYVGGSDIDTPDVDTSVPRATLTALMDRMTDLPASLSVLRQIRTVYAHRRRAGRGEAPVDWGSAEHLAFASLLAEGTNIRMTGQDAERGTFSHRHSVLHDSQTGETYTPLANLGEGQGRFEIFNSCLSEAGVLGFEWGYSLDAPEALVIWEAQFGDFANSAQVMIDQFISSAEDKWRRLSGLVLLLPHGFAGMGPEHSSARLERFLALAAEDNLMICNLTTSAQIFHALRRQVKRPWRKPLVVMSPKSLLRSPRSASTLDELAGGSFHRIIAEREIGAKSTRRVVMCSGKVYYDLVEGRQEAGRDDVAIVRLEQLYPLRRNELRDVFAPYADRTEVMWVQEEPFNMGGWYYINAHLPGILGDRFDYRCVSRPISASPATGSKEAHKMEQKKLVREALVGSGGASPTEGGGVVRAGAAKRT